MGMFDNYDNPTSIIDTTYNTVDNLSKLPRRIFNIKNNFVGYTWDYGDTFKFKLTVAETVKVSEDAYIYIESGGAPNVTTIGYPGQQAYNIKDCKSWTCVGMSDSIVVWIEDDVIIYPDNGTREITFTPDMQGKTLQVDLFNFRWEHLHTFSNLDAIDIECDIDKDISEQLIPGVYYCTLKVIEGNAVELKDKFMFVVQ